MSEQSKDQQAQKIRETVRTSYAQIATGITQGCCGSSAWSQDDDAAKLAKALGYDEHSLAQLPQGADMGLSCGNPVALAALKPGQVVLDLGSGGGFDVFQAGPKVGPTGRVIGVDMTSEMISRARTNNEVYRQNTGLDNVEFRLGEIEHLPVADNSVDVVISNCVINLSPDKAQVWQEIYRVLKPGGIAAVSDIALLKPLPQEVIDMVAALVGCVAGAILASETEAIIKNLGFSAYAMKSKPEYVKSMVFINSVLYGQIEKHLPPGASLDEYVTSMDFSVVK